jgi:hypothetical protein
MDYQKYQSAKNNILDYINDRDKFNRVYYLINENIDALDTVVNTVYKDFDMMDKRVVLEFLEHLKKIMELRDVEEKETKNGK